MTTDPASRRDPKCEAPGPVASDSLAAESLRSETGQFAATQAANPGISGASSNTSTFNVVPHGDEKITTLPPSASASQRSRDSASEHLGPPDAQTKSKAGATGSTGGGKQTQAAFGGAGGARGSKHTGGSTAGGAVRGDSGGAAKNATTAATAATASTTGSAERNTDDSARTTGTVGHGENVDWSRIPKDTMMNPDEDPGRVAAQQLAGRAQAQGVGANTASDARNAFDVLESEEKV